MKPAQQLQKQVSTLSRSVSKISISHKKSLVKFKKNSYRTTLKDHIENIIEHPAFKTYSTLLIFLAGFMDDIKIGTTTEESDNLFNIGTFIIISLFLLEMIFYFIVEENYGCGGFFWIDLIGITSMLLDVTVISNRIIYGDANGLQQVRSSNVSFLKGSKSGKIIRIVRVTKLVKMFNHFFSGKVESKTDEKQKENISTKFEDLSSQKMIILIILLLVAIITFNPNYYLSSLTDVEYGIHLFNEIPGENNEEVILSSFKFYVGEYKNHTKTPMIYSHVFSHEYINMEFNSRLRLVEKLAYYDDCPIETIGHERDNNTESKYESLVELEILPKYTEIKDKCAAFFDNRTYIKMSSRLNIIKTTAILFIFVIGFIFFCIDVEKLVLTPIKNMTYKIENMAKNPISSMDNNNIEKPSNMKGCAKIRACLTSGENVEMGETQIGEKKIGKICAMLSLGFGEAGSQIISSVLQEGVNVEMNPIIPGKKIMGIYGFCDIRNFTDTTEVLQENVMIFVNQVAEIVHQIVSDYCGSANKNIGDAFLLVWKFDEKFLECSLKRKNTKDVLSLRNCVEVNQICDMALIAFIAIGIECQKSFKLSAYRKHKGLNDRMKNYQVRMGFGLHGGYSIEGAIGSMFKIDASYGSPNVNMANHLEEKTKEFGKELIISGSFVDYLSKEAKSSLRGLDVVKSHSGEINRFYSIDLNLPIIEIENESDSLFGSDDIGNKLEKIQAKRKKAKDLYNEVIYKKKNDCWVEYATQNEDYLKCREKFPQDFIDMYNKGMDYFIAGDWLSCCKMMEEAQQYLGDTDVPIENVLKYIKDFNCVAPEGWKGYKEE